MLNNAWPSMIWHLYDYNLEADAGYFATKKGCEPLHIQYSYGERSIVVVNSTYAAVKGLHASLQIHGLDWKQLYSADATVNAVEDSAQTVLSLPEKLYKGTDRILYIDLKLVDDTGRVISRNFYWVPTTLTTFDWDATDYTHTPAERYEDLSALTRLPAAQVHATAETTTTGHGREIRVHLQNTGNGLAFQIRAAARTQSGGLVAPVFWSDNWIELTPGESRTLTDQLPDDAPAGTVIKIDGWNVAPVTLAPAATAQSQGN
jgi:exo-1,4-beta-D-glucosaminidase